MDYFCVCLYTLLFTLKNKCYGADFGNFCSCFTKKNIFNFFSFFSCNFQNFVHKFEKKMKCSIKVEDKVFQYTLNIEWWKSVGQQFRNSALNVTECEKMKWEKKAPKGGLRTKKLADVPYIFFSA